MHRCGLLREAIMADEDDDGRILLDTEDAGREFGTGRDRGDPAGDSDNEVDPTGRAWEQGPGVDVDDPNLSQTAAEAGAEDRLRDLGKLDESGDPDEMRLDDPEALIED
jgi:hypothetical protein